MPDSLNVDLALECVRNIVDSVRCVACDKLEGNRKRYPCGHSVCAECIGFAEECLFCYMSPNKNTSNQALSDDILTQRVKNVSSLLKVCQEVFNTDVYKRQRLSEQLKVEKQLFPQCIQAPIKYSNKKRSSIISSKNKENKRPSYILGENISFSKKPEMEKSVNYVQEWLNHNSKHLTNNKPRKPFSDLNSNIDQLRSKGFKTSVKKQSDIVNNIKEKGSDLGKNRKRSYYKTTNYVIDNQLGAKKYLKTVEKEDDLLYESTKKLKKDINSFSIRNIASKTSDIEENENVINNELIFIDDTQSQVIDKDKLACLAILEANEKEYDEVTLEYSEIARNINNVCKKTKSFKIASQNVPFYKKSYLYETCNFCNYYNESHIINKSKKMSITFESDNFITMIKVANLPLPQFKLLDKHSISIQTDLTENQTTNTQTTEAGDKSRGIEKVLEDNGSVEGFKSGSILPSILMFENKTDKKVREEKKNKEKTKDEVGLRISDVGFNEKKCIIIEESDSDSGTEERSPLQVTADVHRSSDQQEFGVLSELKKEEYEGRIKRVVRGHTPASTDSSDKENFDPNKLKSQKFKTKDMKKKIL